MRKLRRPALLAIAVLFLTTGPGSAQPVGVGEGHKASFQRCHHVFNLVPVPIEEARERVPAHYELLSDTGATVNLQIDLWRCEHVRVGGKLLPSPTRFAAVGFEIKPPPDANHAEGVAFAGDTYLRFLATGSKALADWWRAGTGLEAHYVPGIVYSYEIPGVPLGAGPFCFEAPGPTPSPFKVEGTAAIQHANSISVDANYWQDTKTPDGKTWRVKLDWSQHDDYVAPANVLVTAAPGSEMASVMFTNPATPASSLSVLIDDVEHVKTVTRRNPGSSPPPVEATAAPIDGCALP